MIKHSWMEHYNVLIFDQIDSTHAEAGRIAKTPALGDFVIWGKEQLQGRGKWGREWVSRPGNLYVSMLLQRPYAISELSQLTFLAAVAIGEALRPYLTDGQELSYKWPNDVLIHGKKCAGILLESFVVTGSPHVQSVIVSAGINILHHPELEGTRGATHLWQREGAPQLDALLSACMQSFDDWHSIWRRAGFQPVREAWRRSAAHLGEAITVQEGNERISGIFSDIDHDGALLLQIEGGGERRVITGEIFGQVMLPKVEL